jgi:hypothetical protein
MRSIDGDVAEAQNFCAAEGKKYETRARAHPSSLSTTDFKRTRSSARRKRLLSSSVPLLGKSFGPALP